MNDETSRALRAARATLARESDRLRREDARLARDLRPRRPPWLIIALALAACAVGAWLLAGCGGAPPARGEVVALLGQVYRLEDGGTRVDVTVINVGDVPVEVSTGHVIMVTDQARSYVGDGRDRRVINPGDGTPVEVKGDLPDDARVVSVVVVVPGCDPVVLEVEAKHRRGAW